MKDFDALLKEKLLEIVSILKSGFNIVTTYFNLQNPSARGLGHLIDKDCFYIFLALSNTQV